VSEVLMGSPFWLELFYSLDGEILSRRRGR
jgi:hypothetical protein